MNPELPVPSDTPTPSPIAAQRPRRLTFLAFLTIAGISIVVAALAMVVAWRAAHPDARARAAAKERAMVELLARGGRVSAHFDPTKPGVEVPEHLRVHGVNHPVFEYGYALPVPIPDLKVDSEGISATLSFERRLLPTRVPWSSVFALVPTDSARPTGVWQEDVPEGLNPP